MSTARFLGTRPIALIAALIPFLLFLAAIHFADATPVHVHLVSSGRAAMFTVDGVTHTFAWPDPPRSLTIAASDPYLHEWGIDGSESLTLDNLDTTYLHTIASNPYVAVDRWLRGEDGYNTWRDLRLTAGERRRVIPVNLQVPVNSLRLPRAFTFDADLYRIERVVSVQLAAPTAVYTVHIDRNARSVSVDSVPITSAPTILTQWYLPTDPWPYLAVNARTAIMALIWAAILILLAIVLGLLVPARSAARLHVPQGWIRALATALPVLALVTSLGLTLYVALVEYNGMPHTPDAQAYLLQAKTFAQGLISLPPPPLVASFPVPYWGLVSGHWVAQYAPGTALTLALGVAFGVPWLVQPLLGVGTLALLFALGRRLYGTHVATLAVVLGALSPLHTFLVGTYLSHIGTAFFGTLAYYLLVRSGWGARLVPTLLSGCAIGMTFLCREASALLLALPLGVWLALSAWQRRRERAALLALAAWGGAIMPFLLAYGLYDVSLTGNPLISPRRILNPTDRFGFGIGHGWWGQHTLAAGLVNLDELITGLALDLSGWPFYMTLAVPLIPFIVARAIRWDILNAAIVACVLAGTVGYFYHGIIYGPRYTYEALPALMLLTGRGVQVLGDAASNVLSRLDRPRAAGQVAAHAILIACILPNLLFYLPRHIEMYRNFTALPWNHNLQIGQINAQAPRHALVITTDWWLYTRALASLNSPAALASPGATRDTVWALATSPAQIAQVHAAFPHRRVYILTSGGARLRFEPWRG